VTNRVVTETDLLIGGVLADRAITALPIKSIA